MTASATPSDTGAIGFLLRLARPRAVALQLGLMVLGALTNGFGVITLVPILARLSGTGASDGWMRRLAEAVGFVPSTPLLLGVMVVLAVLRAGITYAQRIQSQALQHSVIDHLRERAFDAVLHAEWRWLVQTRTSDHGNLILTNVARVGQGLNQLLSGLLIAVTAMGYLVAALLLSWQLAVFSGVLGVGVMAAFRSQRTRARALGAATGTAGKALHRQMQQGFAGIRISKAYGTQTRQASAFAAASAAVRAQEVQHQRLSQAGDAVLQVGGAAMLAVVLGVGFLVWGVALSRLLPLLLVFSRLAPMLGSLQSTWSIWLHALPALTEIRAFLDEADVAREPDADASPRLALTRDIVLHDIGVRFAGRDVPALEGVTLTLTANTTTALCGASGAGKSTFADVVMGLIAPDTGGMLVDGVAIAGAQRIAWRRSVAYVQQDAFLFHDTIRANIVLGRDGIDTPAIEQALMRAGAGFVLALPEGVDTVVGDGGVRLSGGERQRVALARALIGAPALLILDEATSALDPETELAVRRTMLSLRGQVTLLFISHRESMREDADQVVTLDRGRVV